MSEYPDILRKARTQLVLRHPFFATLVLGMEMQEVDKGQMMCDTMGTDGKRLYYVREWVEKLTLEEMMAGAEGHLLDKRYYDKAFEEIYRMIPDPPDDEGGCGGKEGDKGNQHLGKEYEIKTGRKGLGRDVISNDSPADETEAKINVQKAATVARQQGKLPAGMEGLLKDLLEPKIKWFEVLRHLMKSKRKDDYDPRRYNRRMTLFDVYLPTLYSEGMGPMVIVRDTSGSTMQDQEKFLTECASIMMEVKPEKLYLIDCDAGIKEDTIREFNYNEGDRLLVEAKKFYGGGGTSFKPPFAWVKKKQLNPEVLVYLTDMYGDFPSEVPGYPVMWVSTSDIKEAPFGMVLPLE